MNVEKPAICINVYRDVFAAADAAEFIDRLSAEIAGGWSELGWNTSGVGEHSKVTQHRTSLSCSMVPLMKPYPETELSSFFRRKIMEPIADVYTDYIHEHMLPNGFHEPFSLLKYLPEAEYHAHYDHFRDNARVFSLVATLGAPEAGGELEFPYHDISIPPTVGSVVMFPANFPYLHVAHPVDEGVKYSLVTWFS